MFCAYLADSQVWQSLLAHPMFETSMTWLQRHAAAAELGDYALEMNGRYVNVHTYSTMAESECVWESHQRTVDIQYVIDGEEGIRWLPENLLGNPVRTLEERDRLEFGAPAQTTSLLAMRSGMFAVFLPREAHCPMIALDEPIPIRKAVVKIPIRLLET